MKSKANNTIEFKPKDNSGSDYNKRYPLNNKISNDSSKIIPYSKRKKKDRFKSIKINKQVNKFNNFEKTHPLVKKYKPIIILFIIMLFISFISFINNKALNNSFGFDDGYIFSSSMTNITKDVYKLTYET